MPRFQRDQLHDDHALDPGIADSPARQAIVAGVTGIARALGVSVLAEGVETEGEFAALRTVGIRLFQGYLFVRAALARPSSLQRFTAAAQAA